MKCMLFWYKRQCRMHFVPKKHTTYTGYKQLEVFLSDIIVESYEKVMADVSALINPERPYVSLADDLPFNDVS